MSACPLSSVDEYAYVIANEHCGIQVTTPGSTARGQTAGNEVGRLGARGNRVNIRRLLT